MKRSAIVFAAAIGIFLTNGNAAVHAAICTEISVPFKWRLSQTTGDGKSYTQLIFRNDGPTGTVVPNSSSLAGSFTISHDFTPPAKYCSQLDPLPTQVFLDIKGQLSGNYANSTLGLDIQGVPFETYVKVNTAVDLLPAFPEQSFGTGSGDIGFLNTAVRATGDAVIPYTGTLNVATKFGFGGQNLDYIIGDALISVSGSLRNPVVPIRYLVPIPEPSSLVTFAGLGAIGLFAAWQRRKKTA